MSMKIVRISTKLIEEGLKQGAQHRFAITMGLRKNSRLERSHIEILDNGDRQLVLFFSEGEPVEEQTVLLAPLI